MQTKTQPIPTDPALPDFDLDPDLNLNPTAVAQYKGMFVCISNFASVTSKCIFVNLVCKWFSTGFLDLQSPYTLVYYTINVACLQS